MHPTVQAKYDFPEIVAVRSHYMVASIPRSGSTLLCQGLWDTGLAGAPMEYFNKTRWQKELYERWQPESLENYLRLITQLRTSPNGVFGFKIHMHDFSVLMREIQLSKYFPDLKYVYIHRNDHLEQAISYVRARQTAQWSSDMSGKAKPVFDFNEINRRIIMIKNQEEQWEKFFHSKGIQPFRVVYECLVSEIDDTIKKILHFLKIDTPDNLLISPPALKKQADELTEVWREKYEALSKLFPGTGSRTIITQDQTNSITQTNISNSSIGISNSPHQQKKIVVIQGGFPALSVTFILDQITGLLDRGFEIENWATYNPQEPFAHKSVTTYGLMDITRYLGFPPESLRPQPALWVQEFLRLNGTRNWDDIGVFHVHYGLNFNHLQPIFRHFTDKPVLVSFHGHDGSRYIRQHGDACYDYLFERACMITTPSAAMKEKLVALGCSPEKIRIHRYGIDLESFRPVPAKASGLPFTFLTVGRLVEKKGIEYALRAFAQLPDRNDVRYRIVGEGPLREKLSALTRRLGIEDSVSLLGAYSKEEVVREMSAADVFVLTSVTAADGDQEGLPVSLIEAQAMGLPVVSSRHAGIPELVQHGATGFLAGEKDVAGISEFMRRLVSDHSLRSVLSINGRKRAEAEFNIRLLNDTLAGYLIEAAEMGRNPAGPGTAKCGLKTELTAKLDEKGWTAKAPLHVPCFESVRYLNHVRNPAISIIVISWRLHPDTPLSLERLSRQRSQHYELIFVDNGGESGAFACLEPHVDTFVRLNRNTGAYLARNAGALFAKAPILLFLDDDCIPAPGLIRAHLDAFRKYDVLSVRGCIVPKTRNPLTRHAAHYHLGDKPFPFYSDVEGNTSYHSSVFYQVGGWDDDIRFGGGGVDLAIRLLDIEPDMRKQIYSPEPLIYHDYAQNPVHLQDKREKQEQSHARLRRKHSSYDSALKRWSRFCGREDLLIKKGIATAFNSAPEVKSSTPITIVIPTYNRAGYLRQSLESALSQSPAADEILVVDDGSTDGTEALMAEFAGRVRYIRKEHSGAPDTRNYAIKHASGEYILWLDSDDVLLGDVLGKYRNIAERNPVVDVIYGNLMITDMNLAPQRRLRFRDWEGKNEMLLAEQVMGNRIPNPGTMIKKECYEKFGFYSLDFPRAHDYEFWSRAAPELHFKHCGSEVAKWRWHDNNMSSGTVSYDTRYEARIIEGMLQRYPLSQLFPDLTWEADAPDRIKAVAYLNLSKRFLLLDQKQLAIKYLKRSYRLHSKAGILNIIDELQSFGQTGPPKGSQPDFSMALAG